MGEQSWPGVSPTDLTFCCIPVRRTDVLGIRSQLSASASGADGAKAVVLWRTRDGEMLSLIGEHLARHL